jgi:hypothetical protein
MGSLPELRRLSAAAAVAACAVFVTGCPQLLDDDFRMAGTEPAPDPNDVTAPTVVDVTPGDGFSGVPPDVVITVTFSEAMDRGSVESAYTSPDLPASAVRFSWSESDTVLRITPEAPLRVASGDDPDDVEPAAYEFELTSAARDVSGNALVPKHVEFSVIREITRALRGVQQRRLTGSWRSDGIYGVLDCEEGQTTICVGDSLSAASTTYKGFVSFDLNALGGDAGGVSVARLSLDVSNMFGDPFPDLGSLTVEHVEYEEIGADAFAAEPLSVVGIMASSGEIGDTLGVDVVVPVNADLGQRRMSQFRFAFSSATDDDGVADVIISDWGTLSLTLTYLTP